MNQSLHSNKLQPEHLIVIEGEPNQPANSPILQDIHLLYVDLICFVKSNDQKVFTDT